ncbi:hypothetical protein E3N88_41508 [Mikania micrantha]|uniref:Uncharacterized protein n=1 Tax=Mikania micrantha TaxID=192012 RepID=A0A5N6LKI4_9ASTR|nr:hypothetical protein E3N88_41508 [Mikania micrantha]
MESWKTFCKKRHVALRDNTWRIVALRDNQGQSTRVNNLSRYATEIKRLSRYATSTQTGKFPFLFQALIHFNSTTPLPAITPTSHAQSPITIISHRRPTNHRSHHPPEIPSSLSSPNTTIGDSPSPSGRLPSPLLLPSPYQPPPTPTTPAAADHHNQPPPIKPSPIVVSGWSNKSTSISSHFPSLSCFLIIFEVMWHYNFIFQAFRFVFGQFSV